MSLSFAQRATDDPPASWSNLPRKRQLCVLALCRLFDFMQAASFQTVCYYQIKSFDSTLSEETLSWQTGIASSSFTGAQIFTAMIWGRIADSEWGGRKRVLLIGLWGTGLSCVGLAFSESFLTMVFFRLLAGSSNGTVGIIRTMISENIQKRKHQTRAFLLLPASFMVASVIGPVCGSILVDPVANYPSIFGTNAVFGSAKGVMWLAKFPYALPALMSAFSMVFIGIVVFLTVEETRQTQTDLGLQLASSIKRWFLGSDSHYHENYSPIRTDEITIDSDVEINETKQEKLDFPQKTRLPFRKIWTLNVITTLFAQSIFDFHMGAFGSLLPLFLSSPKSFVPKQLPFIFNGGLGMEPRGVGLVLATLGVIGITLQFLIYPRINGCLGNVQCFRIFCILFPISYALAPFLAIIPSNNLPIIWFIIFLVLIIHTTGRIFVLPATIVLLNNCAPDPSVLGMVHGIGQTSSVLFRTLGPICAGYWFSSSLAHGIIGAVWWILTVIAVLGWIASLFVWEQAGE